MMILRDKHFILKLPIWSPAGNKILSHPATNIPTLPPILLVIYWWFVVSVQAYGLLNQVMPLVLQLLPYSDLSSVQSLPIMTVDGLGRWRSGG